jgi:hypothetical protein
MVYHDGSIDGFTSTAIRIPEERVFVAVLANSDSPETGVNFVAKKVLAILLGIPERRPIDLDAAQLQTYAGNYRRKNDKIWNVIAEDGRLYIAPNPNRRMEIIPESETSFFFENSFHIVTFELDGTGAVTKLALNLDDGYKIEAVKE